MKAKGARRFGIHSFLASNTISNDYYPALAGQLFELAVELKQETGADIRFINLSGGVGVPYRPEQPENDIFAIGEGVRKKYEGDPCARRYGRCGHLHRDGPLYAGRSRSFGHPGHPRQAHL